MKLQGHVRGTLYSSSYIRTTCVSVLCCDTCLSVRCDSWSCHSIRNQASRIVCESGNNSSGVKNGTGRPGRVGLATLRRPCASERARTTLRASVCSLPTWRLSHAYQTTASGHRTRELTLSRAYSASDRWIRSIRVIWTTSHRWSYAVVSHDSSYLCGLAAVW